MAAPPVSEKGLQSGGTAIWQAAFGSRISFHPEGTVWAMADAADKRISVGTMHSLMAAV
jgi:hypothetical protein